MAKSKTNPKFNVIEVKGHLLLDAFAACLGKVKYHLGAKPTIGGVPGYDFTKSDCSGFVRWILAYSVSVSKSLVLPMGSFHQHEWCKSGGFKSVIYKDVAKLNDSRLRIAFIAPDEGHHGHVWLILNGRTMECYFDYGVGRRKWDCDILLHGVDACYVLTDPLH